MFAATGEFAGTIFDGLGGLPIHGLKYWKSDLVGVVTRVLHTIIIGSAGEFAEKSDD